MELVTAPMNAITFLKEPSSTFDVAYVDPMYPAGSVKRKSLPKKGMAAARVLQDPSGDALQGHDIIQAALLAMIPRVVIKRPKRAPKPQGCAFSVPATNTRYDVILL